MGFVSLVFIKHQQFVQSAVSVNMDAYLGVHVHILEVELDIASLWAVYGRLPAPAVSITFVHLWTRSVGIQHKHKKISCWYR